MKSTIFEKNTLSWIVIILITLVLLFFQDKWDWISKYPKELIVPVSDWINFSMEKFIDKFGWFFFKYFLAIELANHRCAMAFT